MKSNIQHVVGRQLNLRRASLACTVMALALMPVCAFADSATFDIAAQPLSPALKSFATQAHMQLLYTNGVVQGRRASEVHGDIEKHEALTRLLRGTGLKAVYSSEDAATIVSAGSPASRRKKQAQRKGSALSRPSAAGSASAATSGSPDTLQVVLVTAEKRQEPLQTVPVPVSVLAAPALAKQNQFRIQDYASQVPGLSVTSNEFNGAATVAIRGITSGDTTNPTVGATIDDVSIGSSTSIGGGFIVPDLDPSDLANIEVLRGPQGTLYGASSIGGLVKYVTADPSPHSLYGDVRVGTDGVYGGGSAGYDFSAAVNVPLTDTLAMRGSVSAREDPGYIADVQFGRQNDVNTTKDYGGYVATLWRPSDQFSLKINALYQRNTIYGSPYVTLAPGVGDLQQTFLPNTGIVDRKFGALIVVMKAKLGVFDLTSDTGYSSSGVNDFLDYTASTGALTQGTLNTPYALDTDDVTTRKVSQELRLSTEIGSHMGWLLGGYFTHESSPYVLQTLGADPAGNPIGLASLNVLASTYDEWAGFTDLTYHFTRKFDLQIGGRESLIKQTYQEQDSGPLDAVLGTPYAIPETQVNEHASTYLLTPRLRVTPDVMVYGRVASGYRPGGINPGYFPNIPPNFKPDQTINYEVGIKADFLHRRLSIDASIYHIKWQNVELTLIDPQNGASYFTNGGGAKSEGAELSAKLLPVLGVRVGGWVAYDNAVLTQDMPAASTAYGNAGDRLPYSSRISASATADYDFPLGVLSGSVGTAVSYVGERVGAFGANTPGVPPDRQVFPGYTEIDLHSGLNGDLWTLDLYVNNITDKRGLLGGGLNTLTPMAFEVIQPRTIGISMSRTFQ